MTRTLTLTDGTASVSLLDESGFIPRSMVPARFAPDPVGSAGLLRFVDSYNMLLHSTDQDDAAAQLQTLFYLLRKATQFHAASWQRTPVYLTAQHTNETNARYALVYGSASMTLPDLFDTPFENTNLIDSFSISIERGVWRSGIPGVMPSAIALSKTGAPNNANIMPVANYYSKAALTSVFNHTGAAFSSDLVLPQAVTIYGATYDSGYACYFGSSDGAFHNVCFTLAQDREGGTEVFHTYTTDAYASLSTNRGLLPNPASDFLTTTDLGFRAVAFRSGMDTGYTARAWTQVAVNGETGYWLKMFPDATPDTDAPAITTTDGVYTQGYPYLELSSDSLSGDLPPLLNLRMWDVGIRPQEGSSDARAWNVSKIMVGAKTTGLDGFQSHLDLSGAQLPTTDWAVQYDADTTGASASTNVDANAPGGYVAACSFGTTTQRTRAAAIGTNLMDSFVGSYKVYCRAQQIGGSDGDLSLALKVRLGSTDAEMPARLGALVPMSSHDQGFEIVPLGKVTIPFHEAAGADYTNAGIIFEVQAVRLAGTATLQLADLVLIPVDEWSMVFDDPLSDNDLGPSALWGNQYLEYDCGIMGMKTGKYHWTAAGAYPTENWFYGGRPWSVEPGRKTRLYFLMGHYRLGWGVEPLFSDPSSLLAAQIRVQQLYLTLRGAD